MSAGFWCRWDSDYLALLPICCRYPCTSNTDAIEPGRLFKYEDLISQELLTKVPSRYVV